MLFSGEILDRQFYFLYPDSLAHKYNAGPLKSFALAMISRNVEEVMRTRGWKELILSEQVKIGNR